MASVLIVAEHDGKALNPATGKSVACARRLDPERLDIVVFCSRGEGIAEAAAELEGVSSVKLAERAENEHPIAAVLTPQILALAGDYSHVFAPGTTFGRDLMPRVAAKLGVPQISDIMDVKNELVFHRPVYAGNAVVEVEASALPVVGTVRVASFKGVGSTGSAPVERVALNVALPAHTRFVSLSSSGGDRPDLQSARRVISGGRGVGSKEGFAKVFHLADKLGAAVGASRAAVDAGFVANELQVGQTGKIIAPELYIALGISGAIQHLAGIKDAGVIVAVNTDPDAPIFEVADYALVADLFEVISGLEQALG